MAAVLLTGVGLGSVEVVGVAGQRMDEMDVVGHLGRHGVGPATGRRHWNHVGRVGANHLRQLAELVVADHRRLGEASVRGHRFHFFGTGAGDRSNRLNA